MDEPRVAAGEPAPRQMSQHLGSLRLHAVRVPLRAGQRLEVVDGRQAECLVELRFLGLHLDVEHDLGPGKEVVQHIGLEPAEHER